MEETPVPPQPKWTKVIIIVQVEHVLAPEGRLDDKAVKALAKIVNRINGADADVHAVLYADVWKDQDQFAGACEAVKKELRNATSCKVLRREEQGPLMEALVREELYTRPDHGYAIVCSAREKFEPVGLVDNVVTIGKEEALGEKHVDDVIEKARTGNRVFRAQEINQVAHTNRTQIIESAWSHMHSVNNALSIMGRAGRNMDIKSEYEIYTDDVAIAHCQAQYKDQMKKLADIMDQLDKIFKSAFESEKNRIQAAYDADAQRERD